MILGPDYPTLRMIREKYTIVRDMDPELADAEHTTDSHEEAVELLEMAHARRPWARVTIYDEEGRILRRVKPRNRVDWVREIASSPVPARHSSVMVGG